MSIDKEPLIMAIETATRAGSVALARGEEILFSQSGDATASHSSDLLENVEKTLKNANAKLSDVALFAAALGPGSFTGLRIGLATIKSLAVCTDRKCVGVSTLAAIAHAAGASAYTIALLPAGRGEVFAQLFSVDNGKVRARDGAAHLTPSALLQKYGGIADLIWAGEGAHMHAGVLRAWAEAQSVEFSERHCENGEGKGWSLAPRCDELAVSITGLALIEYRNGNTVSPDELQAVYVRPSDAEINERWLLERSRPQALR